MSKNSDFSVFKAEVRRQLTRLGMAEWDVTVQYGIPDNPHEEEYASSSYSVDGKCAVITLSKKYKHAAPKRIAKHEVAHIFLARLEDLAERRFASEHELRDVIESLVTVLEKVL